MTSPLRFWAIFACSVIVAAGLLATAMGLSSVPFLFPIALPFAFVLIGLLIERYRYKTPSPDRPGAGWTDTGERFVDPESNRLVAVYFEPKTGERRYIDAGPGRD